MTRAYRRDRGGVCVVLMVLALDGVRAQQGVLGYDDTPMQPDGKWRVHDINRPRPPAVAPGKAAAAPVLAAPAVVTVIHNGVFVHHATAFWGPTRHRSVLPYTPEMARGPIALQDHRNPVRYRNIWIRPLVERRQ